MPDSKDKTSGREPLKKSQVTRGVRDDEGKTHVPAESAECFRASRWRQRRSGAGSHKSSLETLWNDQGPGREHGR